jgi:hypothetical protein
MAVGAKNNADRKDLREGFAVSQKANLQISLLLA